MNYIIKINLIVILFFQLKLIHKNSDNKKIELNMKKTLHFYNLKNYIINYN